MQTQEIDIVCEDGYSIKGKLFFCDRPQKENNNKNIVIINPALAYRKPTTHTSQNFSQKIITLSSLLTTVVLVNLSIRKYMDQQ